jgi:hypothetical protein
MSGPTSPAGRADSPGQDRLVTFQVLHRQQPDVGGHHHAHVQANDVAGDQVHHVDAAGEPAADHHRLVPDAVVRRRPGPLGAALVGEPESQLP